MDHSSSAVPKHFLCPLTLEVMRHPVQDPKIGQTYERGAILEWVYSGNATCPLTRQPLHPSDLVPNDTLKEEIGAWKEGHEKLSEIMAFQLHESKDDKAAHVDH